MGEEMNTFCTLPKILYGSLY